MDSSSEVFEPKLIGSYGERYAAFWTFYWNEEEKP
jgi:hypothetical protein